MTTTMKCAEVWMSRRPLLAGLLLAGLTGSAWAFEQKTVLDFEDPADVAAFKQDAENAVFDIVADNCVTHGENCLRWVGKMGQPWTSLAVGDAEKLKDFDKYEFVGLDVYSDHDEQVGLVLELWDKDSTDYHTRCGLGEKMVHRGRNTIYWRIDRAKRNNKEGREWDELEPKDKIDRAHLTKVKLFFQPLKEGGDTKLWIDNLRLVPENAVGGKTEIKLPAGAIGYKFGSPFYCPAGFESVALEDAPKGMPRSAKNVIGAGVLESGSDWPDTLTGNGLYCPQGDFTFQATNLPPGEYWVWLSAQKVFNHDLISVPFELSVGDVSLCKEKFTEADYYGEKGIFRYLRTQYSERPNALWLDYALPEAPEFTCKVRVTDEPLDVHVNGMRLSAMIAMPVSKEAEFKKLCGEIREARVKHFHNRTWVKPQEKPAKPSGAGAYTLWMPKTHETIRPWSAPAAADLKAPSFAWRGARGQRLAQRLCVTAWEDLGTGDVEVSDFQGPGTIPAASIRKYHMNYRFQDSSVAEMTLLPWTRIRFEPKITWAYWLWMKIPDDAVPGVYTATVTFRADKGGAKQVPVQLTVHPFSLEDNLPVSYGMYYAPWSVNFKTVPAGYKDMGEFTLALTREQFKFMREIGFTATTLPTPYIVEGEWKTRHAEPVWRAAKESGMGRNPAQKMMATHLWLARRVARDMFYDMDPKLYGYEHVNRNPGAEFTLPDFRIQYLGVLATYKLWAEKFGLPLAMEVVDEPREVPNPWNRRRDEVIRYADWIREAGFSGFVTFIADANMGKDYTPIVDHIDIVSVHAWDQSQKLIAKARKRNKELWYYNTGMDRFSWGFYSWAMGANGRWEWHFCFPEQGGVEGHPNPMEWYTPFTTLNGAACHAPYLEYPGGMTFKSVFFDVAEGINDYAYLVTLEKAIAAAAGDPRKAKVAEEAKAFLAAVKTAIPQYPSIRNMTNPDAGALVGAGLDTPVAQMSDPWRSRIVELLTQLMKE